MTENVYVTGAAGMIGSVFCKLALDSGYSVIGIDNLSRGRLDNMANLLLNERFQFVHADIASETNWSLQIDQSDTIIHLADIVGGISYVFSNEWNIFHKNLLINTNLAKIVFERRPRQLVYVGTACSYPQAKQRSVLSSGLTEDDKFPADPESGYGWSKLAGDIEYRILCNSCSVLYTNIDLHNVYGWPCDYNPETAQVIPSLIYKAITNEVLSVWGDGTQGRAFLEVRDAARALLKAIQSRKPGSFMIGPDVCTTINEIARIVLAHPQVRASELMHDTTKPTGDIGRFYAGQLSRRELNWEPKISIETGINELIEQIAKSRGPVDKS